MFELDDCETVECKNGLDSWWCQVHLREPRTKSKPYNKENWSINLGTWDGNDRTGVYLTSFEARELAIYLLKAANIIDERND